MISQSTKYSGLDIIKAVVSGTATEEMTSYYADNLMDEEEKQIGKPIFAMTRNEKLEYDALCYNNRCEEAYDGYDCPLCKNKGDMMIIRNGVRYYRSCECSDIRRAKRRIKDSGLGELLELYSFDKYKVTQRWQKELYDKAKRYIGETSDRWFVLLGQSGSGKSHICTAIVGELLKKGIPVRYMSWLTDSVEIKQCITDGNTYSDKVNRLKEVQGLYIDDFFKNDSNSKPTAADIKLAIEIINYRYNKARIDKRKRYVTIISSERTLKQLIEYDEAIAGRLIEMSSEYMIVIDGKEKNYRLARQRNDG